MFGSKPYNITPIGQPGSDYYQASCKIPGCRWWSLPVQGSRNAEKKWEKHNKEAHK